MLEPGVIAHTWEIEHYFIEGEEFTMEEGEEYLDEIKWGRGSFLEEEMWAQSSYQKRPRRTVSSLRGHVRNLCVVDSQPRQPSNQSGYQLIYWLVRFCRYTFPSFPTTSGVLQREEIFGECSLIVYSTKKLLYWQVAVIYKVCSEKLRTLPKLAFFCLIRLFSSCKDLNYTTSCSRKCWSFCSCKVEVRRMDRSDKTHPSNCAVSCRMIMVRSVK